VAVPKVRDVAVATRGRSPQPPAPPAEPADPLDRDKLIEAALTLIQRVGVAGLTMRMLGDELGRSTMATYQHVANKEELIAGAADAVLSRIKIPPVDSGPPPERMRAIGQNAFKQLAAYPWVASFLLSSGYTSPNADRIYGALMEVVSEVHPDRVRSQRAASAIRAYLIGWLAGPDSAPASAHGTPKALSRTARASFTFGLDAMIVGILAPAD
jgi:AcrR family transcriptional regulator